MAEEHRTRATAAAAAKSAAAASSTRPDQIADQLIAQIFRRELRPGQRLPPERRLAEELEVDRTSLRMALLILRRMNLVSVVQGSGIVVRDYEQHAGIDLLAAVCELDELALSPNLELLHGRSRP